MKNERINPTIASVHVSLAGRSLFFRAELRSTDKSPLGHLLPFRNSCKTFLYFSSVLYNYYIPIFMGSQVFFPALWENINYGRIWRTAAFNAAGKKFRSD